jgi:serine/threonine protein kinase
MALAPGTRISSYRIDALIGVGGMGEVYRARDLTLDRDVAIKIVSHDASVSDDRRERFAREARTLASLSHPNIAIIHGLEEFSGHHALVMELLNGESLASRLSRGPLPLFDALRVASGVADALDAAHARHIIHRDLKPANIQITADGGVKVLDFGLAKHVPQDADAETVMATRAGVLVGTAPYMSPEQARGLSVDKRTDLWSLGCVLFEMLSGARPFSGRTTADLLAAIAGRSPDYSTLPASTPADVRELIARCLAKDPQARVRDAGDLRHELDRVGQTPRAEVATPRVWAWSRRWVAASVAVAATLASLATWGVVRVTSPVTAGERLAFEVLPPTGASWGNLPPDPQPSVSPDGRHLAYVARSETGTAIWVRDIDSTDAKPLPGTSDVPGNLTGLYWSPDSLTLAYCSGDGSIKKVHLDARATDTLAVNCLGTTDGSWSSRDEIVFRRSDGLFRVPAHGGDPVRLTTIDFQRELQHSYPRWLPDGQRFLFVVASKTRAGSGLFVGYVDGRPPTRVLADESMTDFVGAPDGSGRLVFVRGSTLVALPVNPDTLTATGEPVVLATQLGLGFSKRSSFSASAHLIAYRARGTFVDSAWTWVDRRGNRLGPQFGGGTAVNSGALSPDQRVLVYSRFNRDTNNYGLWMADMVRHVEQPIYEPPFFVDMPSFSPDGREIVFMSAEDRAGFQLQRLTMGATRSTRVPQSPVGVSSSEWSADGKIVLTTYRGDVVAVKVDGSGEPTVEVPRASQPRLSPDGRWLAYVSSASGRPEVYAQRFPGGGERTRLSDQGGFQPSWRGDGSELFYITPRGDVMALALRISPTMTVGPTSRLFRERFLEDGAGILSHYLIAARDGQHFLLNLPTSGPAPLTLVRHWQLARGVDR